MSSVAEAIINLYKTTPQLWIYTPNNNEYTYFNGDVLLAIGIKKLVGVDDFMELKVFFKPSGERSNIAEISTTDETKRTIFDYFKDINPVENNEKYLEAQINALKSM